MGAVLDPLPNDEAEGEQTGTQERPGRWLRHSCGRNANEIVDLRQQIGVRRRRGREYVHPSQEERVGVSTACGDEKRCAAVGGG